LRPRVSSTPRTPGPLSLITATAARLASELGVTVRTVERDVAALVAQGSLIVGDARTGYALREGSGLPQLAFERDEAEALMLGLRWVARNGDDRLGFAADNALARIMAVLPPMPGEPDGVAEDLHDAEGWPDDEASAPADEARPARRRPRGSASATKRAPDPEVRSRRDDGPRAARLMMQRAIDGERKVALTYVDATGRGTRRVVWPFLFEHLGRNEVVAAWCEKRVDYRHFRLDRIRSAVILDERYARRREALVSEWEKLGF
jgi:predicted DNA-binding transcriptional regulator YafY